MSRKYAPPFATLASVQSAGGEAYMQDATFSLAIMSSLLVPLPQLHVQIEDNAFEDFADWKDVIHTCGVEIEGYSIVCFDCIPAPYR